MNKDIPPSIKRKGNFQFWGGLALTVAYLVFVAIYWKDQTASILELKPNEFGDFLAGVFAPLAFLWLVLGFLQQGIELRNSSNALWLQGEELKNSVVQQRELVTVTREQLSFENDLLSEQRNELARNSRPIFKIVAAGSTGDSGGRRLYRFRIFNHGKPCTDFRVYKDGNPITSHATLATGANAEFSVSISPNESAEFFLEIAYLDARLFQGHASFRVEKTGPKFEIKEITESKVSS